MQPRKVKYREFINNPQYGFMYEFMHYGIFHGFGIVENNSAAIIEIEYSARLSSRQFDAQETGEIVNNNKGKLNCISLNNIALYFLD